MKKIALIFLLLFLSATNCIADDLLPEPYLIDLLSNQLNLTILQKKQFDDTFNSSKTSSYIMEQVSLKNMLYYDGYNENAIRIAIRHFSQVHEELYLHQAKIISKINSYLTKQQKEKSAALFHMVPLPVISNPLNQS